MKIELNGEERCFEASHLTVYAMLEELGLQDRRVAVEVNERIVPRANHAKHHLEENDKIEVVHFVGGGE
jgi:sulfur carrier protein